MTSVISIDSVELTGTGHQVAAFVGNECRGIANLVYVKNLNRYMAFLVVYSNNTSGDSITFKAYNATNSQEYDMLNKEVFVLDKIFGSIANPYVFTNKKIGAAFTGFTLKNIKTNSVDINSTLQTITIEVDDTVNISNVITEFTLNSVSTKVTLNNIVQESGVTANNFNNIITYLIYNSLNQVTTWTVKVNKTVISGLDEETVGLPLFYPNPAVDKIYIPLNKGVAQITNLNGEIIISSFENTIDVSSLDAGIYILSFNGKNEKVVIDK